MPGRADREAVSRDEAMTHTPLPRTLSSATGDVQAKGAHKQRRPAIQDLGFRIRDDLDRALAFYPITAKHMTVLSALISFMGDRTRVVFASNRKLSVRLHRLPERTLSRQIKLLVEEGFLRRVMSPNGKRWARRTEDGGFEAFGLDLTPFFDRAAEFAERAAEARRRQTEIDDTRLRLSLLRRRLEGLGAAPDLVDEIHRERRRVPCPSALKRMESRARDVLASLGQAVDDLAQTPCEAEELAANDSHSGRHLQTRNDRIYSPGHPQVVPASDAGSEEQIMRMAGAVSQPELELRKDGDASKSRTTVEVVPHSPAPASPELPLESAKDHADRILAGLRQKLKAQTRPTLHGPEEPSRRRKVDQSQPGSLQLNTTVSLGAPSGQRPRIELRSAAGPTLPELNAVLEACPEALSLAGARPRSWSQLFEAAWKIGRWIGIADNLMAEACAVLGREGLGMTLFGMCERQASIRQPAAYLRSLCQRPSFNPAELLVAPRRRANET